ncbi:peptidase [Streptomyces sp. SP17BM10]|uniref:C1 family peptidase n=1 Tax=Streptomyces sp. SP17BM10 TaxID=3002530 RepID=UPI002E788B7F|nr:peptidase [Streptomyces sp. SP17BM10]MEE1782783.1 peptidase [Streptomyces sp. SP17BM10]
MRISRAIALPTALALSCLTFAGTATAATAQTTAPHPATAHAGPEHGLGLDLDALRNHPHTLRATSSGDLADIAPFANFGDVPASADLTQYALTPGDQGKVGSCVTWATGYSGYGILMNEQNITGAPMAPMYIYSQIAKGNDKGTTAAVALPMEQDQGIDTKAHYWQGDFDYTTQPDDDERANAANYKLSGLTALATSGANAKAAIKNAISQGMPVPIGFKVHKSFNSLNAQSASNYSYLPGDAASDPVEGGHEVTIVAYNTRV